MESMKNYPVKVFATGIVVFVLFSQPLFWGRFFCRISLSKNVPHQAEMVRIEPSRLVPPELENDPNVEKHSYVYSYMHTEEITFINLGVVDYFAARIPGGRLSDVYGLEFRGELQPSRNMRHRLFVRISLFGFLSGFKVVFGGLVGMAAVVPVIGKLFEVLLQAL